MKDESNQYLDVMRSLAMVHERLSDMNMILVDLVISIRLMAKSLEETHKKENL